jgi:hypothetical protein
MSISDLAHTGLYLHYSRKVFFGVICNNLNLAPVQVEPLCHVPISLVAVFVLGKKYFVANIKPVIFMAELFPADVLQGA